MSFLRVFFAGLALVVMQACTEGPVAATSSAIDPTPQPTPTGQTFLFSWGMFADPVFDRDVITFERALTRAYGPLADSRTFGFTSNRLEAPDPTTMRTAIAQLAEQAVDGRDTVVVMLTSHGIPEVLALKTAPNGPMGRLGVDALEDLLAPLDNDHTVLILQACFSGSLIDDLRAPNRIIMTAAAADRSSFGCNPDSDNTWFIKSMNRALAMGGSWEQVFARTRTFVSAEEAAAGFRPSNPQRDVGSNMRGVWTLGASGPS